MEGYQAWGQNPNDPLTVLGAHLGLVLCLPPTPILCWWMLALGSPCPLGLCSFPFPTLGRSPREWHLVMKFREMSPLVLETIRRVASETPGANPKAASFSGWPWVSAHSPGPLLPPGKAWDTWVWPQDLPASCMYRSWVPSSLFT